MVTLYLYVMGSFGVNHSYGEGINETIVFFAVGLSFQHFCMVKPLTQKPIIFVQNSAKTHVQQCSFKNFPGEDPRFKGRGRNEREARFVPDHFLTAVAAPAYIHTLYLESFKSYS